MADYDTLAARLARASELTRSEIQAEPVKSKSPFERGVSAVMEKVPILRDVINHLGKSGATIANLADAAVLGIQGEGDEATERLKSAGRNLFDFDSHMA